MLSYMDEKFGAGAATSLESRDSWRRVEQMHKCFIILQLKALHPYLQRSYSLLYWNYSYDYIPLSKNSIANMKYEAF